MKTIKQRVFLYAALSFQVLANHAFAQDTVPSLHTNMHTEIQHLLNFVASTHCQYERNGTFHNGEEAVDHINKKYAYYEDDIETAEDFIQYSATKSMLSGKYYKVHCNNATPIKSQDWLLKELQSFRDS